MAGAPSWYQPIIPRFIRLPLIIFCILSFTYGLYKDPLFFTDWMPGANRGTEEEQAELAAQASQPKRFSFARWARGQWTLETVERDCGTSKVQGESSRSHWKFSKSVDGGLYGSIYQNKTDGSAVETDWVAITFDTPHNTAVGTWAQLPLDENGSTNVVGVESPRDLLHTGRKTAGRWSFDFKAVTDAGYRSSHGPWIMGSGSRYEFYITSPTNFILTTRPTGCNAGSTYSVTTGRKLTYDHSTFWSRYGIPVVLSLAYILGKCIPTPGRRLASSRSSTVKAYEEAMAEDDGAGTGTGKKVQ